MSGPASGDAAGAGSLRARLRALDRAYSTGHHGRWSARRRSELIDDALAGWFERAGAPEGVALAALGGYGRREQLPCSDVDLLILHDGSRSPDDVAAIARDLLYPLWDAGLQVGQAVRTPAECRAIAHERLDALTAMLDLRFLRGDPGLVEDARRRVLELVRADPQAFAARLREAGRERHVRHGSATSLLEPELKEGEGGLRDLASIGWLEAAMGTSMEAVGALRTRERGALEAAGAFLIRVRSALQLETGKRTDRLILEHQPPIARAMGFQDEPGLIAEDGLMRAVFEHARQVAHIYRAAFARLLDESAAPASDSLETLDAEGVLLALADVAEAGTTPSLALLDRIESANVPDPVDWTDGMLAAFVRLLRAEDAGADGLDTLDRMGLLMRYLPPWREVRCRPQRDPYHRLTVDSHLTGAVRAMARILAATGPADDPVEAAAVANGIDDPDALLLGAFLHDIGKIGERGHVAVGSRIAEETLTRMGVAARTRELASFLVREHLLLPDTATRRDLTDEELVLGVAARVGSPERLAALYLLAQADAVATGPAAWTPWRRSLIRELVVRVQGVFDRGEMGTQLAEQLADRLDRLRGLLGGESEAEVERFVLRMPRGYFLTVEPARAARHFATIAPDLGSQEVRTAPAPGSRPGSYELLVVAADRTGLLSSIAGALAVAGLSILTAHVFTTHDGAAVDLFEVEGVFEQTIAEARWREFRTLLRQAIEGRISLERRVSDKRAHYPPTSDAPITVAVDNDASGFSTVIEVGAPDRIGLLHDITSAFGELQLDVHLAKVATYTGRVIDAFYIRDALGRKVTDAAQISEIETAVRGRLEG